MTQLVNINFAYLHKWSRNNSNKMANILILFLTSYLPPELKRYEESTAVLTEYLRLAPNDSAALLLMGSNYLSLKQYDKARPYFTAVLEREPDNRDALVNYGKHIVQLKLYLLLYDYFIQLQLICQILYYVRVGVLQIHTKANFEALKIFKHLHREYPEDASYVEQIKILEQTLSVTQSNAKPTPKQKPV